MRKNTNLPNWQVHVQDTSHGLGKYQALTTVLIGPQPATIHEVCLQWYMGQPMTGPYQHNISTIRFMRVIYVVSADD